MGKRARAKARSPKRRKATAAEMPLRSRKATAVKGGAVTGIVSRAVDPADPSGNTIYTSGAGGGVWKDKERLPFSGQPALPAGA
jgi:hypothetical protein